MPIFPSVCAFRNRRSLFLFSNTCCGALGALVCRRPVRPLPAREWSALGCPVREWAVRERRVDDRVTGMKIRDRSTNAESNTVAGESLLGESSVEATDRGQHVTSGPQKPINICRPHRLEITQRISRDGLTVLCNCTGITARPDDSIKSSRMSSGLSRRTSDSPYTQLLQRGESYFVVLFQSCRCGRVRWQRHRHRGATKPARLQVTSEPTSTKSGPKTRLYNASQTAARLMLAKPDSLRSGHGPVSYLVGRWHAESLLCVL